MQLADDRSWDEEGWSYSGRSLSYMWDKVYCYFPPYSLLPYCQHRNQSYRGARPELYSFGLPWRPKKLLTAEEVKSKPRRGCCSTCENIKRVHEKGEQRKSLSARCLLQEGSSPQILL